MSALTDDEVNMISVDNLRSAYRELRNRSFRERIDLVVRMDRMRPVYERALDWRRHVTLVPAQEHTARLIAVIDTALRVEEQEGSP